MHLRSSSPVRAAAAAVATLALVVSGCQSTGGGSISGGAPAAAGEEGEDAARKLADQRWELEQARLDLRSAELDAELALRKADRAVGDAEQDLAEAQVALAAFLEGEREHQLGEAQVGLARQENRAVEARMELEELEAMYAEDEFAGKTKELVLERGRRNLALAERSLELDRIELQLLTETELPMKERELRRELRTAEEELADARTAREQAELDQERKLRKARHTVEEHERKLTELVEKDAA